jgi:hypothetical protein
MDESLARCSASPWAVRLGDWLTNTEYGVRLCRSGCVLEPYAQPDVSEGVATTAGGVSLRNLSRSISV